MRRVYLVVTVGAALLFAHALFSLALTDAPLHDDAFNSMVARNLVEGRGYRSGAPRDRAFDPEITTGPIVLLPVALALRLVGPSATAPNVVAALLSLSLFGLVLALIWRTGERGPAVAAALALLVLGRTVPGDPWPYGFWFTVIGEVPGLLLGAAGVLLLYRRGDERWRAVGGLLLGASLLCKIAFVLLVAGALLPALIGRDRPSLRAARWVVLPLLGWQLVQLVALGPSGYAAQLASDTMPFLLWSAGARAIGPLGLGARLDTILGLVGGWPGAIALAGLAALAGARIRARATEPLERFALALAAGAALVIAWWLFRSPFAWVRQVYPAVLALEIACVTAAIASSEGRARPAALALLLLLLLLLSFRPARALVVPPREPSERLQALRATAAFVDTLARDPGVALITDGHEVPRDVALLARARFVDPSSPARRRLLVRNEFTMRAADDGAQRLAARCRDIFTRTPFVVLDCPPP